MALAASALSLLFVVASAQAATRNMVGSVGVINPSVAPPNYFGHGPQVLGKKVGPYAPDAGWATLQVAGTTTGTFVGRQVTLPANRMNFSGIAFRDFAAFPTVAQVTKSYNSTQPDTEIFNVGGGALGQCPGNGCTFSSFTTNTGAGTTTVVVQGTAISWCPPLAGEATATPAQGTFNNQIGDWNCASQQGAAVGAANIRIGISNAPGANNFGGTFSMLENSTRNVWRVAVQPGTDGIAEVFRNGNIVAGRTFEGGRENFEYISNPAIAGPRINARLNANGAVVETFGCVNGIGTVGQEFEVGGAPYPNPGSNCGTGIAPDPGQRWGGRLTTGDLEGSDPWPFISVTTQPPGSAFAVNVNPRTAAQGFFFTRMGTDNVVGTRRNIVLVGGGVSTDPASGNLAFWLTDLRFDLTVPEPAMGLGLVAGATAL
ncbi:MAG: hypothetical protein JRG86_11420, partial [Deltaproteobacteria bacterium]|nr:hypothetical protein [Deltaproteobacteria bacterium]